jgi:predicted acetyltransferase
VHERGEALAVLFASEPGIYRRFGYGLATTHVTLAVQRGDGAVDGPADPALSAQILPIAAAREALNRVGEGTLRRRAGTTVRDERWFERTMHDPPGHRSGASELRAVVVGDHEGPRGYAVFSVRQDWSTGSADGQLRVREALTLDAAAAALLWRTILSIDLIGQVRVDSVAVDDPLLYHLRELRRARPELRDGVHARLVDLAGALAARTYDAQWTGVVEVTDMHCPWNAGRWRLALGSGDAGVERCDDQPDLSLDVSVLGAVFLGGGSLVAMGAAGLVEERTPGALDAAARAFRHDPAPFCPMHF